MGYVIGVDIGGTFTDAIAIDSASGVSLAAKVATTPRDLKFGVMEVLTELAAQAGKSLTELLSLTEKLAHGTTQTSNVLFTWSGARTGLLTTRGFGDELLIMRARGRVAGLGLSRRRHFRATDKPPQIVPRELIEEVAERLDHHGTVIVPLTDREAERAIETLLTKGVQSVAISLLWSHENAKHERILERILRERAPEVYVTLSHRVAPVLGEYERTATTTVNAYVGPTVEAYLHQLERALWELGLKEPLLVVQANGGVVRADRAVPVNTVESGPAAALVAVRQVAAATGHGNVIATDVGGTTFKVGLVVNGESAYAHETVINQYTLFVPMVDLVSIGAGGGSIAWVDDDRLRVGPVSAGADPGPACYGAGGVEPTVTDADLVLGFLNPDLFLGGRMRLDVEAARKAIGDRIAGRLFDGDVARAAAGIRAVVDSRMSGLVHRMTIERGHDPREFVLMAYGGAGPLHAASYARGLGVSTIVIPPSATAYSAYGAAVSDIQLFLQRSVATHQSDDPVSISRGFEALEDEAVDLLSEQRVPRNRMRLARWAEMRYERQLHDVRVTLTEEVSGALLLQALRAEFERRYEALYGSGAVLPNAAVRLLRLGITGIGIMPRPALASSSLGPTDPSAAERPSRPVFWPEAEDWITTLVYHGESLRSGNELIGPAIVEHWGTTIAVPADCKATVDRYGNTVISL